MRAQHPEVAAYLQQVERLLAPLPPDQRQQLVEDCAQHVRDAVGDGRSAQEAIALLGTPEEVAEQAFQEYQDQTGVDLRPRYLTRSRVWQLVGAGAALAAALAALLPPAYGEVTTSADDLTVGVPSLLEHSGPAVVVAVVVPVLLAAAPLAVRGRAWRPVSVAALVLLAGFVVIGSATIGGYFVPALLAGVVGLVLGRRSPAAAAVGSPSPAQG
ncbi:MAG: hypothetical protein Q4G45_09845 [Actinomycetia bacterium]|nr:hypothetical protein [Actinomycetes bacterium]